MLCVNLIFKFAARIVVKVTENMLTFIRQENLDISSIEPSMIIPPWRCRTSNRVIISSHCIQTASTSSIIVTDN